MELCSQTTTTRPALQLTKEAKGAHYRRGLKAARARFHILREIILRPTFKAAPLFRPKLLLRRREKLLLLFSVVADQGGGGAEVTVVFL